MLDLLVRLPHVSKLYIVCSRQAGSCQGCQLESSEARRVCWGRTAFVEHCMKYTPVLASIATAARDRPAEAAAVRVRPQPICIRLRFLLHLGLGTELEPIQKHSPLCISSRIACSCSLFRCHDRRSRGECQILFKVNSCGTQNAARNIGAV